MVGGLFVSKLALGGPHVLVMRSRELGMRVILTNAYAVTRITKPT